MLQTCDFYHSQIKENNLQCFQALKKSERAKRSKEIFQKHKQSLQETNLLSNLYIKNLDPETSESQFTEIFGKFGDVKSFKIQKLNEIDRFSVFKTEAWLICFVCYAEEDSAKKAKRELNGSYSYAKPGLKLFVDYFEPKKQRELTMKAKQMRFFNHANYIKNNKRESDSSGLDEKANKQHRKIFDERSKRTLGNFGFYRNDPVADDNNNSNNSEANKGNNDINFKNRLNFALENDFDFVFAKFRKLFGVFIDSESAIKFEKTLTENENFQELNRLNIGKELVPQNNPQGSSLLFANKQKPLTRIYNKCVLALNKFDFNMQSENEINFSTKQIKNANILVDSDKNNNNNFFRNRVNYDFAAANIHSTAANDKLRNDPPHIRNPFVNLRAQVIPVHNPQLKSINNSVDKSIFNERREKPNMLITQGKDLI